MTRNEIAWDANGKWCGTGNEPRLFPALARKHRGCRPRECGRFICSTCKACVPWCFGGDGTECDDCWAKNQAIPRVRLRGI